MLVSLFALTACGGGGNVAQSSTFVPMTITLTLMTNEETTPEGVQAVQDAINNVTERTFNTHIVLQLYSEEEYTSVVQEKLAARAADKEAGVTRSSAGKDSDVIVNEYGREITVYPDPYPNQIDIFLVGDYNELFTYYQNEQIADLSEAFNSSSGNAVLLNKYTSQSLMNLGKINDTQYAIPSNSLYGEYEYLLINKELFLKYNYDIDLVTDLNSIGQYLVDLANYEKDVIPLYNINEMGLESLTGRPSVVASYITEGAVIDEETAFAPSNILMLEDIRTILTTINSFASINGDYPIYTKTVDFDKKFGAAYITGTSELPEEYEDEYYVVRHRGPIAETSEVYASMFAVSSYTSEVDRCTEIINMINTNPEIRNMLLYGVENVTYTRDENGMVTRVSTPVEDENGNNTGAYYTYSMDMYKTGNLFLVWQNTDMTEEELLYSANDWELAKNASREAHFSPNIGFSLKYDTVNTYNPEIQNGITVKEAALQLELLYDELWVKMREFGSAVDTSTGDIADIGAFLTTIERWLTNNQYVIYGVSNRTTDVYAFNKQYRDWYTNKVYPDGMPEA